MRKEVTRMRGRSTVALAALVPVALFMGKAAMWMHFIGFHRGG
jgi:hypothetical protein